MRDDGRGSGPLASFVLVVGFGMYLIGALVFSLAIQYEDKRLGNPERKDSYLSMGLWWPVIAARAAATVEAERYANEASK